MAQNSYNDVYVTSRSKRQSKYENVQFVLGDVCDENFIASLLINKEYDAVADFMTYKMSAFTSIADIILKNTKQYIFISTARVYVESKTY